MIDIFVLDKNLKKICIIDKYESLIWANRYDTIGDCEIKIVASIDNLKMFQEGMYLARDDDDMVCRVEKIQLNTDIENGNYLIITGIDIKKITSQRIVWKQTNFNGFAEDYIRRLVTDNIINPNIKSRKIDNFVLDSKNNFTETINEQVTYDNLNKKIEETIKKYNWGYKVYIDDKKFKFKIYKGEDKSATVIFSNNYENLSSTDYTEDKTNVANVVLTAGEGEGVNRITNITGNGLGIDRYELYVDARDISKNIDYDDLVTAYPNGNEITRNDIIYYQVDGTDIAIITRENDNVGVKLTDNIYDIALKSKGLEQMAEHKPSKSFIGSVEPNLTFKYNEDYFLGDIVTVENEYGISVEARIVEVIEVNDNNGYSVQPTFEYLEDTIEQIDSSGYILTENENKLLTEANEYLVLEEYNPIKIINEEHINSLATEIQDRKISELSESNELYDDCCMPVVVDGQTKKIYYSTLKEKLNEEISGTTEITIGTTTTGEPGVDAQVVNSGTSTAPILNFTIPRGITGEKGDKGEPGIQGPSGQNGDNGYSPTLTINTNTDTEFKLDITDINGTITTPNLKGSNGGSSIEIRNLTVTVNAEGCALINSNINEIVLNAWMTDNTNGYINVYFTQNAWFGKFKTYKEALITGSHTIQISVIKRR